MKKRSKIYLIIFVFIVNILSIFKIEPEQVRASQVWPEGPEIETPAAIVMEVNTGTILYEKNSHDEHYPASITKIMTTLLAIENCDMDETVVFSADAVFNNEGDTSHISRDLNEELTMEQCLYAVMLESANECAYAVAEHVGEKKGGDYSTFIDMMNEKAATLGCENTHFNNANGLPDENHWTSAYDMALIAREAFLNDTFRTICGTGSYTIPVTNKHDEETLCHNHHKMLYPWKGDKSYLYDYCLGGKTGYTDAAKSTLVTFAEKNGMTLVCVVMYTDSPNQYLDTTNLLNYCFENYQVWNISENEKTVDHESLSHIGLLNTNTAFAKLDEDAYIVLPASANFSDATFELNKDTEENVIAELCYSYGGQEVGTATIVTTGVYVENNPFSKQQDDNEESDVEVIKIKPIMIITSVIGLLLFILIICLLKNLYEDFHMMRHNFEMKRQNRDRYQEKRVKKKKWRKKDRLFK